MYQHIKKIFLKLENFKNKQRILPIVFAQINFLQFADLEEMIIYEKEIFNLLKMFLNS